VTKHKGEDRKSFQNCNILTFTANTNAPKGGDAGHGGKTVLQLINEGGTDWALFLDGKEVTMFATVRLELYGDAEAATFLEGLKYAVKKLELEIMPQNVMVKSLQ
jgi:hypothetical protein